MQTDVINKLSFPGERKYIVLWVHFDLSFGNSKNLQALLRKYIQKRCCLFNVKAIFVDEYLWYYLTHR